MSEQHRTEQSQEAAHPVGSTNLVGVIGYLPHLKAWGVYLARITTWYGLMALTMWCSTLLTPHGEWRAMLCCWVSAGCFFIIGSSFNEPETLNQRNTPPTLPIPRC